MKQAAMSPFPGFHFGQIDIVEVALAALLLTQRARIEAALRKLARHPAWCAALLCALVVLLRLALLPLHPVPTAEGADDFSYLLLGDTLAHFRLANPTHAMHQFFETTFVLQQPSYSSIYPIAQGLVLAFGQVFFGLPWAGVVLSMALVSGLCYWMLRGWTSPGWALVGGVIAVCDLGPLNSWMNCYWGGAVSFIAGCLAFGALPRLRQRARTRDAVILGFGVGLQMLSRPFESIFLDAAVVLFFLPELRRRAQWSRLARMALPAVLALLPCVALQLLHDQAVTGSPTVIPYALSRWQYGVPSTLTFQPLPVPHRALTPTQQLYYEGQSAVHGDGETPARYLARLRSRAGFCLFFLPAPLLVALPFFLVSLRSYRVAWIALTFAIFALGCNFYAYFFPQYVAGEACLFILAVLIGLQRLNQWKWRGRPAGHLAATFLLLLSGAHFVFWYSVHALGNERTLRTLAPLESDTGINFGDPEGRIAINRRLAQAPGRQLVFVRYFSEHGYHEWIHNAADIDAARVVWALELSPGENALLERYYPGRKVWLLEPDADPPKLIPYPKSSGPFLTVE